jgi:hemoglobin
MSYIPPHGPPQEIQLDPEMYALMGENNIYHLLEDFYLELSRSSIQHLFPSDPAALKAAADRSAAFFVFIMGGPPLYQQQFGSPRMRQRHLAFAIDENARHVWLECFKQTLQGADKKYAFPMQHFDRFWRFLDQFSAWMVNTA